MIVFSLVSTSVAETAATAKQGAAAKRDAVSKLNAPKIPKASTTRQDLASSLFRFEAAYYRQKWEPRRQRELNKAFDGMVRNYARRQRGDALRLLDGATSSMLKTNDTLRALWSLQVRCDPPIVTPETKQVQVVANQLYVPSAEALRVEIQLVDGKQNVVANQQHLLGGEPAKLKPPATPGTYSVRLKFQNASLVASKLVVVEQMPSAVAAELSAKLNGIEQAADANPHKQAIQIARSRLKLLKDKPSENFPAEFMSDPRSRMETLRDEVKQLAAGKNPYVNRPGRFWMELAMPKAALPVKIVASENAVKSKKPPLLIALHGAGGDEGMFSWAYGRGVLAELAEREGVLLVCPRVPYFLMDPKSLPALLEQIRRLYDFDDRRVMLVGHSLGTFVAASWGTTYPKQVAAMALVAGRVTVYDEEAPPALIIAGELDPIFRLRRQKAAFEADKNRGVDTEMKIYRNEGHTLVFGTAADHVFKWLLTKANESAKK